MKTVKSPKGSDLPLINLKGKDYMMVAHRLIWFNEEARRFTINTHIIKAEKDESIVQTTVQMYDDTGNLLRSASATKREDSKGFGDHLEKAETGSLGRALAMLGFGTQFALADLDEGSRIVDSPLEAPPKTKPVTEVAKEFKKEVEVLAKEEPKTEVSTPAPVAKANSFKKPKPVVAAPAEAAGGWE